MESEKRSCGRARTRDSSVLPFPTNGPLLGGRPWREVDRRELLSWPEAPEALFSFTPSGRVFYLLSFFAAFLSGPLDAHGFTLAETYLSTLQPHVRAVDDPEVRARPGTTFSAGS